MSDVQYDRKDDRKDTSDLSADKPPLWKILVLCIASSIANNLACTFIMEVARLPLYLDTVFTAAVCFSIGLWPGILTGVILGFANAYVRHMMILEESFQSFLAGRIFLLCTLFEVLVVCFFYKKWIKRREKTFLLEPSLHSFVGMAPLLLTLAALACIVVSLSGGIIGFIVSRLALPRPEWPEDTFMLGLLRNNIPVLASAILSRIPINIVDRFFVIFGGYGISLLFRKLLK